MADENGAEAGAVDDFIDPDGLLCVAGAGAVTAPPLVELHATSIASATATTPP
jgi:hypothetical protein